MRSLPLWTLLALASCRTTVDLCYDPAPGTVLERRVELGKEVDVRESITTIDGKTEEPPVVAAMKLAVLNRAFPDTAEFWHLQDEIVAVDECGPREIVRTYCSLRGAYLATPLYSLRWDGEEDGTVLALSADGGADSLADPAERGLANLVPFDLDAIGLLPGTPVEPGDEWVVRAEDLPLAGHVADLDLLRGVAVRCRLSALERFPEGRLAVIAFEYAHRVVDDGPVLPGTRGWIEGEEIDLEVNEEVDALSGRGELVWNATRARAEGVSVLFERVHNRYARGRTTRDGRSVAIESRYEMAYITRLKVTISEVGL